MSISSILKISNGGNDDNIWHLVSLITFPGIIVHEIAHKFFCDIAKIPVYEVCYFQFGDPCGYVVHAPATRLQDSLLIALGPLVVNTVLCALLTFPAIFPITILSIQDGNVVFLVLLWLGISIGMHAFPSNQDMKEFLTLVKQSHRTSPIFVFAQIFALSLRLVNVLRFVWIDALYAIAVSMVLPYIAMSF